MLYLIWDWWEENNICYAIYYKHGNDTLYFSEAEKIANKEEGND